MATLLYEFVADLGKHISGVPDPKGLIQSIRPAQERFRREIRLTAPRFRPYEKKFAGTRKMPRVRFLDHEDGEVSESEGDETMIPRPATTGSKYNKVSSSITYVDEVFERAQRYSTSLYPSQTWNSCSCRARTRELPGNYPFVVQQTYINEYVKEWRSPAHILCRSIYNILSEHLKIIIQKHFAAFGQGMLEHRVRYVLYLWWSVIRKFSLLRSILIQDHLKSCLAKTEERINWLVDLEDKPFSLNTHYLADYSSKFLAYYRGARRKNNHTDIMDTITMYAPPSPSTTNSRHGTPVVSGVSKVLSGLIEIGFNGIEAHDLAKLLKTDKMEPALEIMAEVRAYFQGKFP